MLMMKMILRLRNLRLVQTLNSPQPQIPVFSDRQPHFPAHSAARPDALPQRARAQRRAASVEVDNPRAHAE
jgi:hypothetical protein